MKGATVEQLPKLGLGVGLRSSHFNHITQHWPDVEWFEAISENFMDSGGRPGYVLKQIAERYPVVLHGVSMSIGSSDPLNLTYLKKLKKLADEVNAVWVSDHLCWTGTLGINSHDLLPVPLNEDSLNYIAQRVVQVQELLERPLILENPSTYLRFNNSTMSEPDFLRALTQQTGCGLLLDVNNVYVSCFNAGNSALDYLSAFPFERVVQLHLAGHQHCGTHIIDTHDKPVSAQVWELFRYAWQQTQGASTLLEWDGDVPEFEVVHNEINKAKTFMQGEIKESSLPDTGSLSKSALSNPVDFLVEEIRTQSHYEVS
ncbi:DUF692 domain-containing protein [Planctobacterium marinum]|uniref:UPF0276 protein n=1 Tax=Planctobacterium marinum TaxID=1631968 RepID=A0AA48KQA4_9ALTE|nr:UPF0276 protein [Planctobacterium marinum]